MKNKNKKKSLAYNYVSDFLYNEIKMSYNIHLAIQGANMHIFIREMKNENELVNYINKKTISDKILIKIKKCFNIPTLKKIDNLHYLCITPRIRNAKKLNRVIVKVKKRFNKMERIILSVGLKKYTNELHMQNKIKLMPYFIIEILKYITDLWNFPIELQNIYVLSNEYNENNLDVINYILDKVKTTTIVTNNYNHYKKYDEKIFAETGLLIMITNNKSKALKKAKIIVNLDFDSKEINTYKINRDAIIINCMNERIEIPYLQGIIINDIDIQIKEKEEYRMLLRRF